MRGTTLIVPIAALLLGLCVFASVGCRSGADERRADAREGGGPVHVLMETSAGEILLELDPERAPATVANFLAYAGRGAYDGTIFHRVMPNFVVQGGGWTAGLVERGALDRAAGRPDTTIRNEWTNGLKNVRGSIAMAREEGADTATREFFINLADNPKLDAARATTGNAGYAAFGRVVEGMGVVDRIAGAPTRARDVRGVTDGSMGHVPVEPVVIVRVRRIAPA